MPDIEPIPNHDQSASRTARPLLKRAGSIALIVALMGLMLWAGYYILAKFLRDRSALIYKSAPLPRKAAHRDNKMKTYSPEEIEKLKKEGKLPPSFKQPQPFQPPRPIQDDPIQRSLRTVEEINRINQMNQRLLEQQQRMQR